MTHNTTTSTYGGKATVTFFVPEENDTTHQNEDVLSETIALSSSIFQHKRIAVDPQILGGQPYIRGTRILVSVVLDGLAEGLKPNELIEHYPRLAVEDIRAAQEFAAVASLQPAE